MNPFETHGIDHLSPSSLNLWAAEPALWVMERPLERRSPIGAAAARGRAVEHGIHLGLMKPDIPVTDCTQAAERAFDREMALTVNVGVIMYQRGGVKMSHSSVEGLSP